MTDAPDLSRPPDLTAALAEIADGAARAQAARRDTPAELPVATIRAAARRRRTRFEAGVGVAAAAAVAVVVLAGSTSARPDEPAPPAETWSSPSPSDTWATGGCGTSVADLTGPTDVPELDVTVEPDEATFTVEGVVGTTITARYGPNVADGFGHWTLVVLVRDGIVVGVQDRSWQMDPSPAEGATDDTPVWSVHAEGTFAGCGADDRPGRPLEPGDYELVALIGGVHLTDGTEVTTPTASRGAPVRALTTTSATTLPACGEPTTSLAPGGTGTASAQVRVGLMDGNGDGQFVPLGFGDALDVAATWTNDVVHRYAAAGIRLDVVVARDGVVVASQVGENGDPPPVDWPAGADRATGQQMQVVACDGGALPPGDYDLWARLATTAATKPDGAPVAVTALAPPVRFRVFGQDDPDLYGPVTYTDQGEAGWSDVDVSAIPPGVPLALEGDDVVTGVRQYEDGRRWLVSVDWATSGEQAYARMRSALLAAGFIAGEEDVQLDWNGWAWGRFSRKDALEVRVDSSTTGDGWWGEVLIVRTD